MITHIDLAKVPQHQRTTLLSLYRKALKDENVQLTLKEAAWMYGYQVQTLRLMVMAKRIKVRRGKKLVTTTHQAMRNYIASKKGPGRDRVALKRAQQAI